MRDVKLLLPPTGLASPLNKNLMEEEWEEGRERGRKSKQAKIIIQALLKSIVKGAMFTFNIQKVIFH